VALLIGQPAALAQAALFGAIFAAVNAVASEAMGTGHKSFHYRRLHCTPSRSAQAVLRFHSDRVSATGRFCGFIISADFGARQPQGCGSAVRLTGKHGFTL
jgi:hypothetical protein